MAHETKLYWSVTQRRQCIDRLLYVILHNVLREWWHIFLSTLYTTVQGCKVGVGVTQSCGNEPGVVVGVDQTASTPTPERFVLNLWYKLPMQGRMCMHLLKIICADIVFKFSRYTHIRIYRGRGAMTFKGGSKGPYAAMHPKCPKMAQNRHIWQENESNFHS